MSGAHHRPWRTYTSTRSLKRSARCRLTPLSDPDAMSQMFKFISRPPLPRERHVAHLRPYLFCALSVEQSPHDRHCIWFLAVSTDESALLSFGDHDIGFDLAIASDAAHWLEHDFKRTGEGLPVELSTVRYLLDATFVGGAEFGPALVQ